MLDFSRVDFNKALGLSPNKKIEIIGKPEWQRKLGDVVIAKGGDGFPEKFQGGKDGIPFFKISDMNRPQNIPVMKIANNYVNIDILTKQIKAKIFNEHTLIFPKVGQAIHTNKKRILGQEASIDNNTMDLIVKDKNQLDSKYLFEYFNNFINLSDIASNANPPSISTTNINEVKILLPPLDIQEEIVKECKKVDDEVSKANESIEQEKRNIENNFQELFNQADKNLRLSDESLFTVSIGRRVLSKEITQNPNNGIPVYSANVFEIFGYINKDLLKDFSIESVVWGIDGDWMVNTIERNKPFYPTDHCGVIRIKTNLVEAKYLMWVLNKEGINIRFSRANRASTERIKGINIKAPDIKIQKQIVSKIEKLELKIENAKKVIDGAKKLKKEILKKYL